MRRRSNWPRLNRVPSSLFRSDDAGVSAFCVKRKRWHGDAAQAVLEREGVGPGDLFLFFGWFRRVEVCGGVFRFVKGAPDVHVLWGWLHYFRSPKFARCAAPLAQ